MTSVCNTGAMAQLAGTKDSDLMNLLHGVSTTSSFLYSYKPEAMYAIDTDLVQLGSGNLTNNVSEVYEAEVPNTFDLVSGCTLVLNVPAIVNVSSVACDLAGSATNANSVPKVRAYVDGPEADASTQEKAYVAAGYTALGVEDGTSTSYLPFDSNTGLTNVKEGDWFEASSGGATTVTGTFTFPASCATPAAYQTITGVSLTGFALGTSLDFKGPNFTPCIEGAVNYVALGGLYGLLTLGTYGSVNTLIGGVAPIVFNDSTFQYFTVTVPSIIGRVGRMATDGTFNIYGRRNVSLGKIGGCVYRAIFARDTNLNAYVGDSSVEVPCSDPAAQFTKYYSDGPNQAPATSQGLVCTAAGVKSDIAAYYQPWAPVQFIQSATLTFDGVCADVLTGTAIQIYYDLLQTKCEKNELLLNACTDIGALKARALQPQRFEVPLQFSFFQGGYSRALNMDRFKYTAVKLKVVTTPYSRMIANGCGSSDFKLTITSDNALGGSSPCTLVTKAGSQVGSTNAFCDSKGALNYASATTISPKDVQIGVRFTGFYLPALDRERLTKMTPKYMVVQQHSVSQPLAIATAAQQTIEVPGNNALSSIVVVAQTQSARNQGRFYDFGGHALAGTGTKSGAFVQRLPLVESVRLLCQGKFRTQPLTGRDALSIAFANGAVANADPTTAYYPFTFGTASPYKSPQCLNALKIPDIQVQVKMSPAVFQNNSASGGFDGKTKVASANSTAVDGGEVVFVSVLVTQHNVIQFDGDTIRFMYSA